MPSSVYKIGRYAVQVLNKRTGPAPHPQIIVRLYEKTGGTMLGTAVFKAYLPEQTAELPVADAGGDNVTAYFDISFYEPFIGILRHETELFWKIQ